MKNWDKKLLRRKDVIIADSAMVKVCERSAADLLPALIPVDNLLVLDEERNTKALQITNRDFEDMGLDGIVFTAGKSGKTPYGQIKKYYREQNGDGATPVKDTTKATANAIEKFRYFYHPDHLGSSSYITDASGEVYQHFEYFPFGENLFNLLERGRSQL